jgi:hypothetical protein
MESLPNISLNGGIFRPFPRASQAYLHDVIKR